MLNILFFQNATVGSSLNTTGFPSCQILATPSSLVIGQTRGVDKMQIRSVGFIFQCDSCKKLIFPSRSLWVMKVPVASHITLNITYLECHCCG